MVQSPSKINALNTELSETRNPTFKTRLLKIGMSGLTLEVHSSSKCLAKRTLRVSPRFSINDTVADPSYTGDRNVKDFDQGLRIVDRNALAAAIPSWAAWLFAGGNIVAIGSLLWVCFTQNGSFLLAVAIGLAAAAVGMRVAERAITDA